MILAADNLRVILTSRGPVLVQTPTSEPTPTPRSSAPTSGSGAASPVTPRFPARAAMPGGGVRLTAAQRRQREAERAERLEARDREWSALGWEDYKVKLGEVAHTGTYSDADWEQARGRYLELRERFGHDA